MPETLTRYILELIIEEWPEPESSLPPGLAGYDKDDATLLTTDERRTAINVEDVNLVNIVLGIPLAPSGERRADINLEEYTLISVSRDAIDPTPEGTAPIYETVETLDIELQAVVADQYGTLGSHAEFRRVVDNVKRALDAERTFPDVSLTDRARQPTRLSLFIGSETDRSANHRDHFRVGFPVRIRGKLEP